MTSRTHQIQDLKRSIMQLQKQRLDFLDPSRHEEVALEMTIVAMQHRTLDELKQLDWSLKVIMCLPTKEADVT